MQYNKSSCYKKAFLIELKRYVSFLNPNLEKHLIKNPSCYTNPNTIEIPKKYKGANRKVYKHIRDILIEEDIYELMDFFSQYDILITREFYTYYKLYLQSRLMYLNDEFINAIYMMIIKNLDRNETTNIIFETLEEEISQRENKRKEKKYNNQRII